MMNSAISKNYDTRSGTNIHCKLKSCIFILIYSFAQW